MSYMAGDYYGGDYMAGSIFSSIGNVLRGAVRGFALGGPAGAIAGARAGLPPPKPSGTNPGNLPMVMPTMLPAPFAPQGPGLPPAAQTQLRIGGSISPTGMAIIQHQQGGRRAHPNKSTYVTRGGGTSRWPQALMVHPKGAELVPSRRMNVANPRALRRSLRRVAGFAKLTKRVRRAVSMAASAVGVHRRGGKRKVGK